MTEPVNRNSILDRGERCGKLGKPMRPNHVTVFFAGGERNYVPVEIAGMKSRLFGSVYTLETDLIVTCHPSTSSLCASILQVVARSSRSGRVVIDDLANISFNPIISSDELRRYYLDQIPDDVRKLAAHLREAHRVIFILPIWMYDMPALLKGYFERVWRPHVAYRLDGDRISPLLSNIKRLVVIVTHGRNEEETIKAGDATRQFFEVSLPTLLPNLQSNARFDFYSLDAADATSIENGLEAVRQYLASLR
jgi:NAD(P)H dehydrogenase (quinone)